MAVYLPSIRATWQPSYLWVGATSESGTTAAYDMNGGLLDMSGNTLGIALGDRGW
jgi:flagellar basal body rod protein FlgF